MKNALLCLLTACLSLGVLTHVSANSSSNPVPFDAQYSATIKGFAVSAHRSLHIEDNGMFSLRFNADSWAANIEEISQFHVADETLNTHAYNFKQTALGSKKERSLRLSDDKKTIESRNHKDSDEVTRLDVNDHPILDKLNYQLQLAIDVAKGKDKLSYTIIDKGERKHYRFNIVGDEVISTDSGTLNTTKVEVIRDNADKSTFIWFAKDWHYLLAQLKQYEKDKEVLSIHLQTATVNNTAVKGL